jgi:hypothetical protein
VVVVPPHNELMLTKNVMILITRYAKPIPSMKFRRDGRVDQLIVRNM